MNSDQAKKLSLPALLERLGHQPTQITKGGKEYWYLSPFRQEMIASFHTSFLGGKWIWNDFGDTGGTVIDFVMRYKGYHHVQEALQFLEAIFKAGMAPSAAQEEKSPQGALFDSVAQVENPVLELKRVTPMKMSLPYIAQRGIDEAVAKLYLKEVHFINSNTGKNYFAAGIKNVSGGYEIRNPYFKSSIGKKDLSFVPGEEGRGVVSVFEGVMDFLTYLTEEKRLRMPEDVIILNSISFLQRAKSYLQARRYTRILTFFDNDRTGELATEDFLSSFPSGVVIPQNQRYSGFVDYNSKIDLS